MLGAQTSSENFRKVYKNIFNSIIHMYVSTVSSLYYTCKKEKKSWVLWVLTTRILFFSSLNDEFEDETFYIGVFILYYYRRHMYIFF